jgi:hypothetical protein
MDPLNSMSVEGGSNMFPAGTYSTSGKDSAVFVLTYDAANASDTIDITVNGVTRIFSRGIEDMDTEAMAFVAAHYATYLAVGVILTQGPGTGDLTFIAVDNQTKVSASVVNNNVATFSAALTLTRTRLPHPVKIITSYDLVNITSMRHRVPGKINQVATLTITGSSGTASISLGKYKMLLTFATSLYQSALNFVTAQAAKFAGDGNVFSVGGVAQVETVTLSGASGTANITVAGGLTKLVTYASNLTTTAAHFVIDHAAAYAAVGIIVTSSAAKIKFTSAIKGKAFAAPVIGNATGDLAGSVAHTTASATAIVWSSTKTLFDAPIFANLTGNLAGTVVVSGDDGLLPVPDAEYTGVEIENGNDIYMEYPVEQIVIGSGIAILHFVK